MTGSFIPNGRKESEWKKGDGERRKEKEGEDQRRIPNA